MKNKQKKSGAYFLKLLPSEIQSMIEANLAKIYSDDAEKKLKQIKQSKFLNLAEMLGCLFDWEESKEGRKFWEETIDKKYDNKDFEESTGEIFDARISDISNILEEKLSGILVDLFGDKVQNFIDKTNHINNNPSLFKSGHHYAKELSEDEKDRFIENLELIGRTYDEYLDDKYYSFNDFMASAFPFFSTKEGVAYWSEIRNRETEETLDDVLTELNIPKSK
jgi:hypothetical protein